ncbi:MAG: archaemetzincin family Zn-dependent metalloprotease [Candidatus Bathyarchaeia archaeon]
MGEQALSDHEIWEIGVKISETFGKDCTVLGETMQVPRGAYIPSRFQYDANLIMPLLQARLDHLGVYRLLAITNVDLYSGDLNFIFGESECPGRVSLVSTYRLMSELYGEPPHRSLFLERCLKECIHELGHSFGLAHCSEPHCVMCFSNSVLDTDRKSPSFCPSCKRKFGT